jgi:hypothetical protein
MTADRKTAEHKLYITDRAVYGTTPEALHYGLSAAHGLIKKLYAALPAEQRPQLMRDLLAVEQVILESSTGTAQWDPIELDAVEKDIQVDRYAKSVEARSQFVKVNFSEGS